ncbi:MAG: RNA polymerase sigma factor [Planctomycetota bacterium]|jgi:RNA polymerase sigma-70 factor (ECF subfamily)
MELLFEQSDLQKLLTRDTEAVKKWFHAYSDTLYTFVYYRVGKDSDIAAEVVQETFLQALRKIANYDWQRGSMLVWLTYLSKNNIKKELRAKHRHISYEQVWQEIDQFLMQAYELIATEPLPGEILEREETAEIVRMTLSNIPGNYKVVLTEYYYQQKAVREIAVSMGVSEGAVKVMLHRAREAFKAAFLRLLKSIDNPEISTGGLYE